jgi:hypothetical protein
MARSLTRLTGSGMRNTHGAEIEKAQLDSIDVFEVTDVA